MEEGTGIETGKNTRSGGGSCVVQVVRGEHEGERKKKVVATRFARVNATGPRRMKRLTVHDN